MTESEFPQFRSLSVQHYAEAIATSSGFSVETVLEDATKQFDQHLSHGLKTPDNYVYYLKSSEQRILGHLWFGVRGPDYRQRVFIFDIFVVAEHRRQGAGKFMLHWLDKKAAELGHSEIALHAFAYNTPAIRLYESHGYEVTNVHMNKKL